MVRRQRQQGLAYLWLLFLLTLLTLGLGHSLDWYSTLTQRQRERQLLWVGQQYVKAIGSYYQSSPGTLKRYPASLADLLEDKRFVTVRRHLRRLYADPITGKAEWTLIQAPEGGVMGVASTSTQPAWKRAGRPIEMKSTEDATRYDRWPFVYQPAVSTVRPSN